MEKPAMETKKPDYLYNPALCPCPRGEKANYPHYKHCDACIAFHRIPGNPPQTACEKKAEFDITSDH